MMSVTKEAKTLNTEWNSAAILSKSNFTNQALGGLS